MDFFFGKKDPPARRPARRPRAEEVERTPEPEQPKESDDEVVARLPKEFYLPTNEFDPTLFMLEAIEERCEDAFIQGLISERERQLDIINGRLSDRVMQDYDAFVKGMMQIQHLGVDLQTTAILCRQGRSNLKKASEELTKQPLEVVAKSRKMQRYRILLAYVEKIRSVREKEMQLRHSLEEGDFPTAISLCLQCTKNVPFVSQFPCMRGLNNTLKESYDLIAQKLDSSLAEVTRNFDATKYERVLQGYRLTGNSAKVLEKLQRLFIETIQSNTQDAVYAHVVMSADNAEELKQSCASAPEDTHVLIEHRMKFKALCNRLEEENFISCLLVILEYACSLMLSHYQMSKWHDDHDKYDPLHFLHRQSDLGCFADIKSGLQRFRKNMWDEMQRKVVVMLSSSSLPTFKIDAFLQVLANVNTFISFGEEFAGGNAHHLRGCIKQQSKHYFQLYHIKKTEDLYTMLENEMWAKIPVNEGFSLNDLIEYRSFLNVREEDLGAQASSSSSLLGSRVVGVSLLASYASSGRNPFSIELGQSRGGGSKDEWESSTGLRGSSTGPALGDDAEEIDEELMQDFVEDGEAEEQSERKQNGEWADAPDEGPVLTSATINLAKFIGKYVEMMSILQPIAYDVFVEITHLFEYYVYAMILFFGHFEEEPEEEEEETMGKRFRHILGGFKQSEANEKEEVNKNDPKYWLKLIPDKPLRDLLLRIEGTLIAKPDSSTSHSFSLPSPHLSEMVDLSSESTLFGLSERSVAIECLVFLIDTLEQVKPHIRRMLPKQHVEHLNRFYSESVEAARGMRRFVYLSTAVRLVNLRGIPKEIEKVRWDTKEIGVEYNGYVDTIIHEVKGLMKKMSVVETTAVVPAAERLRMIERVVELAMEKMLDGYAAVTKNSQCTPEGRTLMCLDSKSLQSALEKITPCKPLPKAALVDNYLKAYYCQEDDLLRWILDNQQDFSVAQLMGLVTVSAPQMPKKAREQLWSTVEAVCANKKRSEAAAAAQ